MIPGTVGIIYERNVLKVSIALQVTLTSINIILFQVVDWLNAASLTSTSSKVELLSKVQETIINNDINLLDNFLDEMLAFQSDRNADVRKFIVGFIEEAR